MLNVKTKMSRPPKFVGGTRWTEEALKLSGKEAAMLSKAKCKAVSPKTEADQLLVCRLIDRCMMTIGGMIPDNGAWVTFKGGYALAHHCGKSASALASAGGEGEQ